MKTLKAVLLTVFLLGGTYTATAQHHGSSGWLSSTRKSPALAAALSLQPLPMDLGGFYAGNWERASLYTAAEIALFVPAVVLLAENAGWRHHGSDSYYYVDNSRRRWTRDERNRFYYLVGGYFLVKLVSAFDAGYSVERQNARLSVGYNEGNKSLGVSLAVSF